MSLKKSAGWELFETSDVKRTIWYQGKYLCAKEYVEELWVNKRTGKQSKQERILKSKMILR